MGGKKAKPKSEAEKMRNKNSNRQAALIMKKNIVGKKRPHCV